MALTTALPSLVGRSAELPLAVDVPRFCQTEQGDSWSCAIVYDWTGNEDVARVARWLIGTPLAIVGLVLIGVAVRWLLHKVIDRIVGRARAGVVPGALARGPFKETPDVTRKRRVQRAETMGSLLKSIITTVIVAVVSIMVISELGYDVAPLIASAGILGVALGFGAQSLVKDYLSGIFMIFEDQYGVGDDVDLGEAIGTIEAVGLRVTRLRDVEGTVWYVRNGEILRVGNMSQNWARTVLDVQVAYNADLPRVREVIKEVAREMWQTPPWDGKILEEPEVWGVQEVGPDGVTIRLAVKTAPQEQWGVGRELRQRIKTRFDKEGIDVPFPDWTRGMSTGSGNRYTPMPDDDVPPPE